MLNGYWILYLFNLIDSHKIILLLWYNSLATTAVELNHQQIKQNKVNEILLIEPIVSKSSIILKIPKSFRRKWSEIVTDIQISGHAFIKQTYKRTATLLISFGSRCNLLRDGGGEVSFCCFHGQYLMDYISTASATIFLASAKC